MEEPGFQEGPITRGPTFSKEGPLAARNAGVKVVIETGYHLLLYQVPASA